MTWTRLRKVGADFLVRWERTLLTLLGLSLGLFGVGAVLVAFTILANDLEVNFTNTNPPNVVIQAQGVTPEALERVEAIPGVVSIETRNIVTGRMEVSPGSWMNILLFSVEDFDRVRVSRFFPEGGAWPPPEGGFLMERDGRFWVRAEAGTSLPIRLANGRIVDAVLSGNVYDPGQAPSRMDRIIYGYVSRETLNEWAGDSGSSRLIATLDASAYDARDLSVLMQSELERAGVSVNRMEVYQEPEHPHQFQFNSIIAVLAALAIVSFLMCAVLTVNLIDAVMANEQRSIGILRAIGGKSRQITGDYLLGVGLLGLCAGALSIYFSLKIGRGIALFVSRAVNFDLLSENGPFWLPFVVLAVGALIPMTVASLRIARTARMPVREAISRVDPGQSTRFAASFGPFLSPLPLVQRMAVRNLARKPRRTILTAVTLAIGLAFFMMSLNVRTSMMATVESVQRTKPHDIALTFQGAYPVSELREWIAGFDNVQSAEYWAVSETDLYHPGGRNAANPMPVYGVPYDSAAIRPDVISGQWLDSSRPTGVVITQKTLVDEPDLRVGNRYRMNVGGRSADVEIIGIVKEFGSGRMYVPLPLLQQLGMTAGRSNHVVVTLDQHDSSSQSSAAAMFEASLLDRDWQIAGALTTRMWERVIVAHLEDIAGLLRIIAVMALFIGAMGLASSISVAVVERYREIGLLKAIGGRAKIILNLFVSEAVTIALLGLAIALLVSPWLSREVGDTFGTLMIEYPFDYRAAPEAMPIALGISLLIALIACILPVRSALKMTIFRSLRSE